MTSVAHYFDTLFFGVLPYVAMVMFIVGTIYRYRSQAFTYSSLSSQLLENKQHFWALVPFHYGIIAVLVGHIVAFLVPRSILVWNSQPLRLYILEVTALIFGLTTLVSYIDPPNARSIKVAERLGGRIDQDAARPSPGART